MKKLILSLIFAAGASLAIAQDAEGCKDHPLFNRMPNFIIDGCTSNFSSVNFQMSKTKSEAIEGNVTTLHYVFNSESGAKMPSILQIVKNYENAIVSKGGKKVYQGADDTEEGMMAVYSMSAKGKEYWVSVRKFYEPQVSGEVGSFALIVLEKEPMKQDIEASEMFKEISSKGSIALYINFETGKADIKPESEKIVDQIAMMMKQNGSLKVSIEGHTDNAGNAASNLTLSENRAKAVMNAVAAKGIEKTRMTAKGHGQNKPLADNGTEEGKAKNRRVEIVKQ